MLTLLLYVDVLADINFTPVSDKQPFKTKETTITETKFFSFGK